MPFRVRRRPPACPPPRGARAAPMGCASSKGTGGASAPRIVGAAGSAAGGASAAGVDAKNLRVKLVLLGDSGVGKSCIVLRFVHGQFDPSSKVTVGAAFLSQVRSRALAARSLLRA